MAFIFVASSIPDVPQLPGDVSDKTVHFWVYAVLGILVCRGLAGGTFNGVTLLGGCAAILVSGLYAVSDEVHQLFVPGRSPDVFDVIADTLGASGGVAIVWLVGRLKGRLARQASSPPTSD
jgi:VanZ family protein